MPCQLTLSAAPGGVGGKCIAPGGVQQAPTRTPTIAPISSTNIAAQSDGESSTVIPAEGDGFGSMCKALCRACRCTMGQADSSTAQVISLNLKRRQLTPSQRAAAAVEALPHFEAEAESRKSQSNPNRAILPPSEKGKARDHAAKATGASPRYVQVAKAIKEHAGCV